MQKVVLGRTIADLRFDFLECEVNKKHLSGKLFDLMA